jgi:hypothetical protein
VIFRLVYSMTRRGGEKHDVDEAITLQTSRLPVGGDRWWFACPLVVTRPVCGRRVGKLYLPPSGRYFGCRHCYDLTYQSSQESHKYDRVFAELARETGIATADIKHLLDRR